MAGAGIGNPAGAVQIFDFGAPMIIPGVARAETVSGGVFCFGSTATGVVSSGATQFDPSVVLWTRDASGLYFNGIAMYTAGSNQPLGVAVGGVFLLPVVASMVGGQNVDCTGLNAVAAGTGAGTSIGRAITAGASGGYALVHINP